MGAVLLLVFVGWLAINAVLVVKTMGILRAVPPQVRQGGMARWFRGSRMPDDVPEALRGPLRTVRRWRAAALLYLFASVVAIVALALTRLHAG